MAGKNTGNRNTDNSTTIIIAAAAVIVAVIIAATAIIISGNRPYYANGNGIMGSSGMMSMMRGMMGGELDSNGMMSSNGMMGSSGIMNSSGMMGSIYKDAEGTEAAIDEMHASCKKMMGFD